MWTKHFPNCSAASPTIADGIVYQAYMHELPCSKHATGAEGFVVAWNAKNGRQLWRVRAGTVESTPLLVGKMLYFGSWDRTSTRTGSAASGDRFSNGRSPPTTRSSPLRRARGTS